MIWICWLLGIGHEQIVIRQLVRNVSPHQRMPPRSKHLIFLIIYAVMFYSWAIEKNEHIGNKQKYIYMCIKYNLHLIHITDSS